MFCVVWDLLKLKSEEQCNQKVAKLKSKFPVILSNNTREHAYHVPATPTPNEKPLGNSWACRKTTIGENRARKMDWNLFSMKFLSYAMLSLRLSLSKLLHCLLHVLCFTVLILGEVDKAFIDVISQSEEGQNSSFANMVGKFARIGAMKQVEGELKEVRIL